MQQISPILTTLQSTYEANMRCDTVHIYVVNMICDPLFFAVCNVSLYHEIMEYSTVMHYMVTK